MGAFRKNIVVQVGTFTLIANIESAVEKEETLKSVCTGVGTPHAPTAITRATKCPECGEIGYADIKKAKVVGDQFLVMEQDEVAEVKTDIIGATKKMLGLSIHPADVVRESTLPGDSSTYALVPADASQRKVYAQIVDMLWRHTELTMLGTWTPTSRPTLYEITLFGSTLVMQPRARVEDVKVQQVEAYDLTDKDRATIDLSLEHGIIDVEDFDPVKYADTFRERLAVLAESKTAVDGVLTAVAKSTKSPSTSGAVVDMTDQLAALLAAKGVSVDDAAAKPKRTRKAA